MFYLSLKGHTNKVNVCFCYSVKCNCTAFKVISVKRGNFCKKVGLVKKKKPTPKNPKPEDLSLLLGINKFKFFNAACDSVECLEDTLSHLKLISRNS